MSTKKGTTGILISVWAVAGIVLLAKGKARADFVFGTPENLGATVNSPSIETEPSISSDGLELFFNSSRPGGSGRWDLWVSARATTQDDWGTPTNLGPTVNSAAFDLAASISADGLSLYFCSNRSDDWDIWVTTRPAKGQPWGAPVKLGSPLNSTSMDVGYVSPDGLSLYIGSDRPGGHGSVDLLISTRATVEDDWGSPVNLGPTVNAASGEIYSSLSTDGCVLFFSGGEAPPRAGGYGQADIWMTRRRTTNDEWGTPVNLGPNVNSPFIDRAPSISADGSTLYFCSDRSNGNELWQVSIDPVVDLTGDFRVDIEDLLILIEHWGTDEPLCDMGPMPWGDGIVDARDLEVLMRYWDQDIYDPNLLAHWKLDEADGDVAYDSAAGNDAVVMGQAQWQPEGGQVDGALQLDGVDDYVGAPFVLNPVGQPFSVFAWIKGGQPGQTIVSQKGGFGAWLSVDGAGALGTGLTFPMPAVTSNVVITDDNWHRIGLVSDGAGMSLYVDDVEVARTPTSPILPATGNLQIGAGANLGSGSFWSGMIDDVRIYGRVVVP